LDIDKKTPGVGQYNV